MAEPERLRETEDLADGCFPWLLVAITLGPPAALTVALVAAGVWSAVLLSLVIVPLWALAGVVSLVSSIRSASRRAWRRSLMTSILPLTLVLVATNPLGFVGWCDHIGEVGRFIVSKPYYDHRIASLPADQRPGPVVFVWDGFLGTWNGVVYDKTDEVALPADRRSAAWLARARNAELGCNDAVRPLWDHYYLGVFWC